MAGRAARSIAWAGTVAWGAEEVEEEGVVLEGTAVEDAVEEEVVVEGVVADGAAAQAAAMMATIPTARTSMSMETKSRVAVSAIRERGRGGIRRHSCMSCLACSNCLTR